MFSPIVASFSRLLLSGSFSLSRVQTGLAVSRSVQEPSAPVRQQEGTKDRSVMSVTRSAAGAQCGASCAGGGVGARCRAGSAGRLQPAVSGQPHPSAAAVVSPVRQRLGVHMCTSGAQGSRIQRLPPTRCHGQAVPAGQIRGGQLVAGPQVPIIPAGRVRACSCCLSGPSRLSCVPLHSSRRCRRRPLVRRFLRFDVRASCQACPSMHCPCFLAFFAAGPWLRGALRLTPGMQVILVLCVCCWRVGRASHLGMRFGVSQTRQHGACTECGEQAAQRACWRRKHVATARDGPARADRDSAGQMPIFFWGGGGGGGPQHTIVEQSYGLPNQVDEDLCGGLVLGASVHRPVML